VISDLFIDEYKMIALVKESVPEKNFNKVFVKKAAETMNLTLPSIVHYENESYLQSSRYHGIIDLFFAFDIS
jgi:hypothetical protein